MSQHDAKLEFINTPLFEASIRGLLDDESLRRIERELLEDPERGDLIQGTGGLRKLRAAPPGRGKRGGARVIYFLVRARARIYFLLAYAKSQKADLTIDEKHSLQALARRLEKES